ncbi:TetR/AcrR family transcriptional regulator [Microbacterium fluvii]|uniref:TetR/AcrR family transcriptional regulator n=1 Tax=Microbacterium fluvii TaxID=415215 RepID=A0ABW2H9Z8_9MICO|nr:TetR/AcrR family transcriptional regulator [Microbacterium fluvii]MCU4671792.1 TetR/AcrR family transcriptional regulator [Microbacterium fluvii]
MSMQRHQPKSRPETIARRREIVKAAAEVFGAKGYTGGTLVDIAEQVGMTHAGILHHFGSKDQLLLEVLAYRDETDVEALEGRHIPDGADLFRHLVRTAFANEERAGIVQSFVVLSAESVTDEHPAREFFRGRYETLRGEIEHAFGVMCDQAGIDEPDTVAAAAAGILAVMDGLQVQWLLEPDGVALAESTEFAISAIVSAVLGQPFRFSTV